MRRSLTLADAVRLVLVMSDNDALARLGLDSADDVSPSIVDDLHQFEKAASALLISIETANYLRRFG